MLPTFFKHRIALCITSLFINVSSFAACPGTSFLGTIAGEDNPNDYCEYNRSLSLFDNLIINGDMTINGNFTIYGNLTLNGTLTINGNLTIDSDGTFQVNSTGSMEVTGDVNNAGWLSAIFNAETEGTVGGTVTVGGDFNNNDNGNITIGDGGVIDVGGAYTNNEGSSTTVENGGTLKANPIDDSDQEVDVTGSDDNCTDTCCGDEATCNVLLPVELVSFTASLDHKGSVTLLWETATEINNEGFYIQKSPAYAEPEWTAIAFVKGNGNVKHAVTYEYIDHDFTEDSYYRLRQVDFDGQFEIHRSVYVKYPDFQEISIYPNPFSTELNIKISDGTYELSIFDVEGHQIHASCLSTADLKKELKHISGRLEPGNYIISIRSNTSSFTERIIKN